MPCLTCGPRPTLSIKTKNTDTMNYNYLSDSEKILIVLDKMGAVSPETAITTEEMVGKGIELGMTKEVLTDNWHGHKEGDHPWWLLLAAMSGTGSEEEVAKHNVPYLHRQKVQRMKNGRKTKVMVYWYDESYTHEITYTGKEYKQKLIRQQEIRYVLEKTKGLPKSKEERMEQMRKDPNYVEIDGKFYTAKFVVAHPEKFNPVMVMMAQENING